MCQASSLSLETTLSLNLICPRVVCMSSWKLSILKRIIIDIPALAWEESLEETMRSSASSRFPEEFQWLAGNSLFFKWDREDREWKSSAFIFQDQQKLNILFHFFLFHKPNGNISYHFMHKNMNSFFPSWNGKTTCVFPWQNQPSAQASADARPCRRCLPHPGAGRPTLRRKWNGSWTRRGIVVSVGKNGVKHLVQGPVTFWIFCEFCKILKL